MTPRTSRAHDAPHSLLAVAVIATWIACQASQSATIYADSAIGSTSCTTYDPAKRACSGGSSSAYRTLAGAAAVATPGTTVIVRGGTYTERLRPGYSGTAAAGVTYRGQAGETPTITGAWAPAVDLTDRSYVTIENLTVSDVTGWLRIERGHYNVIRNNRFTRALATGTTGGVKIVRSNYNKVLDNIIEDGNDNLLFIEADRNLAQGNRITKGRHAIWGIKCGNFNVIRDNYFANDIQKIGEVFDCAGVPSDSPIKPDATKHNLIENNVFALTMASDAPHRYNGIQYSAQNGIIRRNVFHDNRGGALGMSVYADEALHNKYNRVCHNVMYGNGCMAVRFGLNSAGQIFDNRFRNNVLYRNRGCSGGSVQVSMVGVSPFDFGFNEILFDKGGESVIQDGSGVNRTLAWWQANYPQHFHDNVERLPLFVNEAALDFRLQPTSPLVDAGTFLTHATSTGAGVTLPVEDVDWFFDGFGIPGEQGDLVQFEGQTQTARVIAINYTSKVLTLDRPLAWSKNQRLATGYSGVAPDMGAYELQQSVQILPMDFNADGRVDHTDLTTFIACASRAGVPQTNPQCAAADLDRDGDVDQSDFGTLQACYRGPLPADPSCIQ